MDVIPALAQVNRRLYSLAIREESESESLDILREPTFFTELCTGVVDHEFIL